MSVSESEDAETLSEIVQEVAYVVTDETNCSICQAEFLDAEDLKEHIQQVHRGSNKCQFCESSYTGLDSYASHIVHHHWKQLKSCRYCTKFFTDRDELRVHEKKHERQKVFGCSQCTLLFPQSREVELHEKLKHDNDFDGVFLKCMIELIAYLKLYPPAFLQSEERYSRMLECGICSFTTFEMPTYLQHLTEEKCEAFVCDNCGKMFKSKTRLPLHFNRKRKCTDAKYYTYDTCPNCLEDYPRMTMDSHKKTCKVIFKCKMCVLTFDSIDELSNHQAQNHPLEVDIRKCKFCSKEFLSVQIMNKHIDKFHKPKFHQYKYECKMCSEAYFKHPLNLFRHYFTKHRDFEPYTCRVCDKKFRIRKKFTFHIKLDHKSIGFVEFDDQYNVFFTDKKSEIPFIPKCVIPNVDLSNILKQAESENETDIEGKRNKKPRKSRKSDAVYLSTSEDEEVEPLLVVKKRAERRKKQNKDQSILSRSKRADMMKRRQFTCNTCGKYCYTYQNYHNHIKLHTKHQDIDCIKCSRSFSNKKDLKEHMATDHATSKLIETLKSVLERKQGDFKLTSDSKTPLNTKTDNDVNSSERFAKTIKKVKMDKALTPASIVPSDNISAKKFIENFMPEINDGKEAKESVTISLHNSPYYRLQTIKLHKFVPEKMPTEIKLRMPEKFKEDDHKDQEVKIKVKVVQMPVKSKFEMEDYGDSFQDDDYKSESIPEVAQEVMLEGCDEPPRNLQVPQKIVIPRLPAGYGDIRIGTLAPQAPFFKIIKVKAVKDQPIIIDTSEKKAEPKPSYKDEMIQLCDGTKLVSANPLAHLLGERQIEDMMEPFKNKYYKPTLHNVKGLIAEALENIDKPSPRKQKKKEQDCTVNQPT